MFVIGVLVGAVIATGAFYIYSKTNNSSSNDNWTMQTPGGNMPSMPNGQMPSGQPPEKPNGDMPTMPNDSNVQNNG